MNNRTPRASAIYHPIPTPGRLHLKIGHVGACAMAQGSAQVTNIGFSDPSTPALGDSDMLTQVSIIGAGASPPFVPLYPTGYPGTMLVSRITGIFGNSVSIEDAAQNATQPGAANFTVYREVSTDINTPLKVQWTLTTSSRGTLTATVYDHDSSLNLAVGMPVLLYDDVEGGWQTPYFGGAIDTLKARNIPGRVPGANPTYWDIQAVSWSHLLDKRLVNQFFPGPEAPLPGPPPPPGFNGAVGGNSGVYQPGQFVNMYLGDIVNQLVFGYCDSEGLNTNLPNGHGPIINFFQANAGQDTIAQAIDNAAQVGYSEKDSWFWWIDGWKKVFFVKSQVFYAPWNIDETGVVGDDASILLSVSVETTREKLCNSVYIDSSQTIGATTSEYYIGDSSKHSYSVGQPVGSAPTVWIQGSGRIDQTVAVKGGPLQMGDWLWSMGDNSIEKEQFTTLAANCDGSTNNISVVTPLRLSVDDSVIPVNNDPHSRKMIQIDQEYMRIRSGSTTTTWHVDRGATLRGITRNDSAEHDAGASIYAAGLVGKQEQFWATYQPLTKQLFVSPRPDSPPSTYDNINKRAGVEGGTGFWNTQISLGNPFYDPYKTAGSALADAFVADFGVPPVTFEAETYRPGLQIGYILYVKLLRPAVDENFLIDQMDFTAQDKRQKWSIHAINGALIGDWRKAFLLLNDQFAALGGAGSTLAGTPGSRSAAGLWLPGDKFGEVPMDPNVLNLNISFKVAQSYLVDQAGNLNAQVNVGGAQPLDSGGAGIPIQFKVRREFVAGVCGQECVIDPGKPGNIFLGTHSATDYPDLPPLVASQFKGRVMSIIARYLDDPKTVPLQDFTITDNDDQGNFTVTPDPVAAGVQSGFLVTIRTGRDPNTAASDNDSVSTDNTFKDPLFPNNYDAGLTPDGNVGNIALVIAGTGAGQEAQQVIANTADTITVSPGWAVRPDATSCVIVVDNAWQVFTASNPTKTPDGGMTATLPVRNYNGMAVRVEGYLAPEGVVEGAIETVPWREIYLWGAQGTRLINIGNLSAGMFNVDQTLLFDTSSVNSQTPPSSTIIVNQPTTLAADVVETDVTITTADPYAPPNGTIIQVGGDPYEQMQVTAGSGTTTLTVQRGWGGTTPLAHLTGDAVSVPCGIIFTLLPFAQVPNQVFYFSKISGDITYVQIQPTTPDTLPDGELFHVLVDTSTPNGTYNLKVPTQ